MSERLNITLADSAIRDLENVREYYRDQQIPNVGERLIEQILQDVELLGHQPEMGRVVPEFELEYLREIVRPPFRIVYRRDRNRVRVVRVWRSERPLESTGF